MPELSLGVVASSRKPDERRLAIHPAHIERIDPALRRRIFLERGYGHDFGIEDKQLGGLVAGMRQRQELMSECDVVLLPKPLVEDLADLTPGAILWGWPHCVQDEELTQVAIDRRLTLIAWEAMNYWTPEGAFSLHVFHKNNELAGYCSVLHALELTGTTGAYGRRLRAAVVSYGATGRGALTALFALGVHDVDVLTQRSRGATGLPHAPARLIHYERDPARDPHGARGAMAFDSHGVRPVSDVLSDHDIVVNCVLQDTDNPLIFVTRDDLERFASGSLFIDVSCDEGMGFDWARPTSFTEPMLELGRGISYYAVDHSPSHLWNSATWEISEALIPFLEVVMAGEEAWKKEPTIRRAIEIHGGLVQNPKILSFQSRASDYPHERLGDSRPANSRPVT